MTSINLTHAEARDKAELLDVASYDVDIDLRSAQDEGELFSSRTTVTFTAKKPGSTFIDLRAARIESIELDGQALPVPENYDETNGIALNDLSAGEHTLTIAAQCVYSRTGEGLHRFTDPADGETYLYTQFETAEAKRMFACFDQPDLKATYAFRYTVPPSWTVIGNGVQEEASRSDEAVSFTSSIPDPLSTYLVAVCAGPYAEFTDSWSGELTHHPETPAGQPHELTVPLGIYARASIASKVDAERLFTETKQGFDFYHRHFGVAYPFGKYDQVFVPEFNAGAMENAGCVTIRDEYIFTSKATHYRFERRADTILHELAHMWFGDLVTMQWWDDLWLNESFATWASAVSQAEETKYDTAWVTFAVVEKAWAYQQDQLPTTHPVTTDARDIETVEQNFDGITYAKGASVLKQLQAYVGRENFFAGVRRHFARHAYGNATFDDLLSALEEASGRDLSEWAGQWLRTTGMSSLTPRFSTTDQGTYESFSIAQGGETMRTHRIAVGLYRLDDDGVVRRYRQVETDISGAQTEVDELHGEAVADLVIVNDDDLTYCAMGLDEGSLSFVLEHIADIEDPMARALCWSAAWEHTRSGELPASSFAALVAAGANAESELAVLERIVAQAITANYHYSAQADEALLVDAYLQGAHDSDEEKALIFAQALTTLPLSAGAQAWARGVLAGEAGPLVADNDLKWRAATALLASGATAELDDISRHDHSSSGELSRLRAEAARPEEDNKQRVFAEVTEPGLSNLASRFRLQGLRWGFNDAALMQFNERYFEIAEGIWEEFSSEMGTQVLEGLYPSWDVSEEGLKRADDFLARISSPGLSRLITEERDHVARALRLREIDRAAGGAGA